MHASGVGVDGTRAVLDAKHSACCMHATAPLGNPCRNQGGATHQEPVATSASTRCLVRAAKPATRPPGAGTARVAIVIVRIPGDMGNHPGQLLHPKVLLPMRCRASRQPTAEHPGNQPHAGMLSQQCISPCKCSGHKTAAAHMTAAVLCRRQRLRSAAVLCPLHF